MEDNKIKNEFGNFAEKPQVPKKLYDFKYIVVGLLIFFGLVFLPVLPNLGKTVAAPTPKLDTPAIQKLAAKDRKCVMPTEWMRANHMQMLVDWRESVVPRSASLFGRTIAQAMMNPHSSSQAKSTFASSVPRGTFVAGTCPSIAVRMSGGYPFASSIAEPFIGWSGYAGYIS